MTKIDYEKLYASLREPEWLLENIIFLTVHGSQAYGTATAQSDIDLKGICIPPKEYFLGYAKRFEQKETTVPYDAVVYHLHKFMKLAQDCNPNIIELLFVDEKLWVKSTPVFEKLHACRHMFLSKKARYTFSGYAHAQLKRIKGHRNWLLNPPTHAPSRAEFGLSEVEGKMSASEQGAVKKLLEDGHALDSKVMTLFVREQQYHTALQTWKQYENWKRSRNEKRAVLEARFGYDCFTADTEFLTQDGFKRFDDISIGDSLATIYVGEATTARRQLAVEFQKPTERFDGTFTGNLYHFKGYHLDTCVTPNHRMMIRPYSRKNQKLVGLGRIQFKQAASIGDSFQFLIAPSPKKTTYSSKALRKDLPEEFSFENYLRLMGWYLSDGCMLFFSGKKSEPKEVRISQKKFGKLSWHMQRFFGSNNSKIKCTVREASRKPNEWRSYAIIEKTLGITEKNVVRRIFDDCNIKENKHIPRWAFRMSKRHMDILLIAMCRGDGTERTHKTRDGSIIYYSKSKLLADNVQELALMCGYETSLYGPYTRTRDGRAVQMHQVHIRKTSKLFKTYSRQSVLKKLPVKNERIVCFSVPNGTLITRRNGHIGIHGNCKHAAHLVRLMRMCKEILETGEVQVCRPDAEELLAIRDGAWTYDELISWAEAQEREVERLYVESSALPKSLSRQTQATLDALAMELVEEHFSLQRKDS